MSQRSDDLYLVDLIEHSESMARIIQGQIRESLDKDEVFRSAVYWNLFVIGETASKLSPLSRKSVEDFPWNDIRGVRNHLAHGYFQLNRDRIWSIVVNNVPVLKEVAEKILTRDFPDIARQLAERRAQGLS